MPTNRSIALARMTAALEAAKRVRDRGISVSEVRKGLQSAPGRALSRAHGRAQRLRWRSPEDGDVHRLSARPQTGVTLVGVADQGFGIVAGFIMSREHGTWRDDHA